MCQCRGPVAQRLIHCTTTPRSSFSARSTSPARPLHVHCKSTGSKSGRRCAVSRGQATAYQTLATELRTAILQGKYPDGMALPTEAELVEQHHLSRQTVRRAFQELVADDLVYRVPGRGTFASPTDRPYLRQFGSIEELMGLSLDTELELLEPLSPRVDVAAAGRLRANADVVSTLRF
ncbi:MAG: GntR family transcriptional regulator, partial [Actinobacteria bacterium]|nr:GntR family transcriptional regulator [Actinomycetota bacterium]